jgi:hypothetical protein
LHVNFGPSDAKPVNAAEIVSWHAPSLEDVAAGVH